MLLHNLRWVVPFGASGVPARGRALTPPRVPDRPHPLPHPQVNWLRWLVPLLAIFLLFRIAKSAGGLLEDGSPANERRFALQRRQARKGERTVKVLRTALGNVVSGVATMRG